MPKTNPSPNKRTLTLADCVPLRAFVSVVLVLWLLTILVGLTEHFVFRLSPDYWWPFFAIPASSLFGTPSYRDDFTIYRGLFGHFHQSAFFVPWHLPGIVSDPFPFTYPAPAAMVFHFFFMFGRYAEQALYATFLAAVVAGAFLFGRALQRRGLNVGSALALVLTTMLLSYPILFALERGNIELINGLLVWAAIGCIWKRWWYVGAIVLGLAISFKLFPFVLLGIFIAQRKYLPGLVSIATAAIATLASYFAVGPTFAIARAGIASGLDFFQQGYVLSLHLNEVGFDHSLFAPVKLLHKTAHHFMPAMFSPNLGNWLRVYLLLGVVGGLILFFGRIVRLPLVNQVVTLVSISLLLPPLSADYTLLHLYAPFACLALFTVSAARAGERPHGLVFAMLLMGILVAPESYLFLHHIRPSGLLKTLALVLLVWTAVSTRWEDHWSAKRPEAMQTT